METEISTNKAQKEKITTIKISRNTKERLEHLRSYKRESYEEIMEKMLSVLNLCRLNPEQARAKLVFLDKERRRNLGREKLSFMDRERRTNFKPNRKEDISEKIENRIDFNQERNKSNIKNNPSQINKLINRLRR